MRSLALCLLPLAVVACGHASTPQPSVATSGSSAAPTRADADDDGDGVANLADKCPAVAGDASMDGCPKTTSTPDAPASAPTVAPPATGCGPGVPMDTPWFAKSEPVDVAGARYVKFGLPRVLGKDDVRPVGKVHDVDYSAEPGAKSPPDVIYVPVAMDGVTSGCAYQPYEREQPAGANDDDDDGS